MLTPEYLDRMPDGMVELYAQAEADILADMARRIKAYDYWVPSAEHQKKRLEEMGAAETYIYERLSGLTGKSEKELRRLFRAAAEEAVGSDRAYYTEAGLDPPALDASEELQSVLNAGLRQTNGLFRNLTRTTAGAGAEQFGRALDRAWMQVSTGAFDVNTAVRRAVKELAGHGLEAVRYESGATSTIEAAVRRAVVTGVNQACLKAQWALADQMESDLVEVTAHAGARPEHAAWQGKVYSRSGRSKKYPDFVRRTGYGSGEGLGGWNCRHSFFPYFEGAKRTFSRGELAKLDDKTIEYNGKKLTEYEASQEQRCIERQIRRWKRENAAMQAAGEDTYESAAKIKAWQDRQKDFVRQTGLKRQYDREQAAGFGKKQAAAVRRDLAKYRKYRYNKDGTIVVTDDWTEKAHPHLPTAYRPFAVLDTVSRGGEQHDRVYYDKNGRQSRQISSGPHGNAKKHPFGAHGEHAHDIVWEDGKIIRRTVRALDDQERKENADIL